MLLILAAQRRLLPLALAAADGDWDVYEWPLLGQLHRLRSRTIGIIGLGRIGHLVAQKLHGFRPTVIAYDPFIEGTRDPEVELVSLDELAARSDIVVSCAALTDTSRGIIGADFLSKTKPGVLIVNVSRGGIVAEDALVDALDRGHVAYAALDVRSPEPPDPSADRITGRDDVVAHPAHRRELGRIDRGAPRRGSRADHQAAARSRPAAGRVTRTFDNASVGDGTIVEDGVVVGFRYRDDCGPAIIGANGILRTGV